MFPLVTEVLYKGQHEGALLLEVNTCFIEPVEDFLQGFDVCLLSRTSDKNIVQVNINMRETL